MISPELQEKILCWQQKVANDTITPEELKEALAYLRSQRNKAFSPEAKSSKAVSPSTPKASKEKAPPIDTKALLASLFAKKEEPPTEASDES